MSMAPRYVLSRTFSLVLTASSLAEEPPVIRSTASGPWSAAATWEGGKVPAAGARVLVLGGHTVTYDVKSDAVIRAINISGTLAFAQDRDTLLNCGLIKIEAGDIYSENGFDCEGHFDEVDPDQPRATLRVGTPNEPLPAQHSATIRLHAVEGLDPQSCPAIVCCGGRMDFHGAPLSRTWVKLGATAAKGATEATLSEPVTGWRVGDRIIFTATTANQDTDGLTEERIITAIDGQSIRFAEPLAREHGGEGEFRGEVANLSRNVVVESADPTAGRGHTMYHRGSAGAISYAEFRHLGKRDTLGRYSLHFHLCGSTMRGSYVIGASIWDSHNRWLTIHGTNYLVVRDNVGYKSVGHGYFLEDGTEVFNILDRNLAVAARHGKRLPKQVLPFDQNEGAGYWWANSLNTFTRNVAADCDRYGFRYEATPTSALKLDFPVLHGDGKTRDVDIRTLPFVRFDGNEVHDSFGLYGINLGEGVRGVGPDAQHPFIMRNTRIWNVHYGLRPQAPSLLVENLTIKSHYGIYHPNFDNHVYRNVTIKQTNTEPFNRGHDDDSVQHGILAVDGLVFDGIRSGGMPLIQISDDNATGRAVSHFRGVETTNWEQRGRRREASIVNLGGGPRPNPKTDKGVPIYLHDWFGAGRSALVVSTRSPEYKAEPNRFREEPPLTGDESRVAEVTGVAFPDPLAPIDDLPPQTVITHLTPDQGTLVVRGSVADNGEVKRVVVDGQDAKLDQATGQWEARLALARNTRDIVAHSEDAAGNIEQLSHKVRQ
jgi:hypothetical protein